RIYNFVSLLCFSLKILEDILILDTNLLLETAHVVHMFYFLTSFLASEYLSERLRSLYLFFVIFSLHQWKWLLIKPNLCDIFLMFLVSFS
ncbi:hypothetical protein ACJX0J_007403, partial [Zea mays]